MIIFVIGMNWYRVEMPYVCNDDTCKAQQNYNWVGTISMRQNLLDKGSQFPWQRQIIS